MLTVSHWSGDKTTILYCSTFLFVHFDGSWPNLKSLPLTYTVSDKYDIAVVNIHVYGHPNIRCEDQHRLTNKNVFYLELKRNRQFYRLSVEEITIRLPAPPMTNNYEKTFALKLFGSHTTRIIISIQLQIIYIWRQEYIKTKNIPLQTSLAQGF
jgi:hypothetical protein